MNTYIREWDALKKLYLIHLFSICIIMLENRAICIEHMVDEKQLAGPFRLSNYLE